MGTFHACQLGVIVLLARCTPPEVLGQVEFSLAVSAPLIVLLSFELRGALVADAAEEFTFGTYRALRRLTTAVASAVLLALTLWQLAVAPHWWFGLLLAGMAGGKLVLALVEVNWGLFQKRERLDLMAASAALRGAVLLLPFVVLVPLVARSVKQGQLDPAAAGAGAAAASLLYVLSSVLLFLLFDERQVAARADHATGWTWHSVRALLRRTFPLGLVLLFVHTCDSLPALFINAQPDGKAALGHFSALARLTLAGNLLIFHTANAAANRLARSYQTNLASFLRLTLRLLGIAVAVGAALIAGAWLAGAWVLRVLYGSAYAAYFDEFRVIILAQGLTLLTVTFGVLLTQMRLFWLQVPAQFLVLLATAAAALWLIPGSAAPVRGGAYTILVRALVHLALYGACLGCGILLRDRVLAGRVNLAPEPPIVLAE